MFWEWRYKSGGEPGRFGKTPDEEEKILIAAREKHAEYLKKKLRCFVALNNCEYTYFHTNNSFTKLL